MENRDSRMLVGSRVKEGQSCETLPGELLLEWHPRRGPRAVTRRPPGLLAAAPAGGGGEPVALPGATRIAALLHGDLVEGTDRHRAVGGCRAGARLCRRWRAGRRAGG